MLAILNYTEQHFIAWAIGFCRSVCVKYYSESCSMALVLIASPVFSYNMRAPKCFSKEARENIVCLFLFHISEMHHCPLQSLSKAVFKPWVWQSHFYCLTCFGLVSFLFKYLGLLWVLLPRYILCSRDFYWILGSRNWVLDIRKNQKSSSRGQIYQVRALRSVT